MIGSRLRRRLPLVAVVPLLLSACATGSPAPPLAPVPQPPLPREAAPYAAYVLLGEAPPGEAAALARVIVDAGAACPELAGERGGGLAMGKRANPHGFTVDVCEAAVPFGERFAAADGSFTLPVARRRVERVAVMGDTGCKPQEQDGCGLDDPEWPFPVLAAAAAARRPQLVLHVGDYNYRGTPSSFERSAGGGSVKTWYYDAGDGAEPSERCEMPGPYYSQNSTGNPDADAWEAWWLDFFQPAGPLLAAAPWVFARGNHELCSHAGPGWFYFLDSSSSLEAGGGTQLACPPQDGEGPALPHLVFAPPRVVALDGLALAVLDSANACDELPNFTAAYADQLAAVAARLGELPAGTDAWLAGHRPPWGLDGAAEAPPFGCDGEPGSGPAPAYDAINRTLQCAFAAPEAAGLPARLALSLSGHMHRFESLDFAAGSGRPPQLVVGNSGVQEETGPPVGSFSQMVDGVAADGASVEAFGFLELERRPGGGWAGTMFTPDPAAWPPAVPLCAGAAAPRPFLCAAALP
jgi:hypothetical protein